MKRDEFWRMHPDEFWWLWDMHQPRTKYGKMTQDEAEQLKRRTWEWAKARNRLPTGGRRRPRRAARGVVRKRRR